MVKSQKKLRFPSLSEMNITINTDVATKLGITIPEDIKDSAQEVTGELINGFIIAVL